MELQRQKKNRKSFNGLLCKRCSQRMTLKFTLARNRIQNSKFYLRHKITIHMKLSAISSVRSSCIYAFCFRILSIWWNRLELKSIICTKWFCFNLPHPFAFFHCLPCVVPSNHDYSKLVYAKTFWICCIATTNVSYKFRNLQ